MNMNKVFVSGVTVVLFLGTVALAYGLAAQVIPVSVENQVQMRHIPNTFDGRLGYISVLNATLPTHQGAELDRILPPMPLDNELQAVEQFSVISQAKEISQTKLMMNHGNCGGY